MFRASRNLLTIGCLSTIGEHHYRHIYHHSATIAYSQERQPLIKDTSTAHVPPTPSLKDPKDCEIPACHSTKEMMKLAKLKRKELKAQQQPQSQSQAQQKNPYEPGCPVMREQLGTSTWNLIHTIAANYPNEPSEVDKENVKKFFETLSYLYPCPHCAEDFQKAVTDKPPE
jgi:hypothetical protein